MLRGRCLSYGEGITFWPIKNVITEAAGLTGEESRESAREKIRFLVETAPDADLIVDRVADADRRRRVRHEVREARPGRSAGSSRSSPAVGRWSSSSTTSTGASRPFSTWSKRSPRSHVRRRSCCSAWRGRTCSSSARTGAKRALGATRLLAGAAQLTTHRSGLSRTCSARPSSRLSVRRRITEAAEGNPLFVEEMVAMLVDEGLLVAEAASRPDRRISSRRSRRCSVRASTGSTAKTARSSSEGRSKARSSIAAPSSSCRLPTSDRSSTNGCAVSWSGSFSSRAERAFVGEQAFGFRHQLLRDVAYESVPKALRSELHERFAGWLERQG